MNKDIVLKLTREEAAEDEVNLDEVTAGDLNVAEPNVVPTEVPGL